MICRSDDSKYYTFWLRDFIYWTAPFCIINGIYRRHCYETTVWTAVCVCVCVCEVHIRVQFLVGTARVGASVAGCRLLGFGVGRGLREGCGTVLKSVLFLFVFDFKRLDCTLPVIIIYSDFLRSRKLLVFDSVFRRRDVCSDKQVFGRSRERFSAISANPIVDGTCIIWESSCGSRA